MAHRQLAAQCRGVMTIAATDRSAGRRSVKRASDECDPNDVPPEVRLISTLTSGFPAVSKPRSGKRAPTDGRERVSRVGEQLFQRLVAMQPSDRVGNQRGDIDDLEVRGQLGGGLHGIRPNQLPDR